MTTIVLFMDQLEGLVSCLENRNGNRTGYQFDYVFDWTILKYPQIGASSRGQNPSGSAVLNPGPSAERPEKTSVGQDIREKFSGAVDLFSRRHNSGSGQHGDRSRHRTSEDVTSSKDVVLFIFSR
ncbi:hypothetical protein CsSME_00046853 [Camellia sinensis var. sinensis]